MMRHRFMGSSSASGSRQVSASQRGRSSPPRAGAPRVPRTPPSKLIEVLQQNAVALANGDRWRTIQARRLTSARLRHDHALGPPGGAGGVDDIGGVLGPEWRGGPRPGGGAGARAGAAWVRRDPGREGELRGSRARTMRLVSTRTGAGVVQHLGEPLGGVLGIERHVRPAGLEHGEHRDHLLRGTLQRDAHQPLRPYPVSDAGDAPAGWRAR